MASPRVHDFGVDDPENFMLDYRYSLSNIIDCEQAIPYLMKHGLLDKTDQEIILNTHKTSVLRSGDLIDMVLKRGPTAFNVLMEFIEFEYPEIFERMMKTTARAPDPSKHKWRVKRSARLSQEIKSFMESFRKRMQVVAKDLKEEAESEFQEKLHEIEAELEMRDRQIHELSQTILEVTAQNKELILQTHKAKQELFEAQNNSKMLMQKRDDAYAQVVTETDKSLSRAKTIQQSVNRNRKRISADLQAEIDELKKTLHLLQPPKPPDTVNVEFKTQTEKLSVLEKENKELKGDIESLIDQVDHLANEFDLCENQIINLKQQVASFKEERDTILRQYEDIKNTTDELQSKLTELRYTIIEESRQKRLLESEASCQFRNRVEPIHKRTKNRSPNSFEQANRKIAIEFQPYTGNEDICGRIVETSSSEDEIPHGFQNLHVRADNTILRTGSGCNVILLRGVSLNQGKKKSPLVLYAPRELRNDLQTYLVGVHRNCFVNCPYEKVETKEDKIPAMWTEGGHIIHYTKEREGLFGCLGTNTLESFMKGEGRVLLHVPIDAIQHMHSQSIYPLVLVVRYQDANPSDEMRVHEAELFSHQLQYETLIILRNTSMDSIASMIVHKVASWKSDTSNHGNCNAAALNKEV